MSDWGWHSFQNTKQLTPQETENDFDFGHGHQERYAVEFKQAGRQHDATDYFRVNPHRLNLGAIGLMLKNADGRKIELNELTDIHQQLKLWDGIIESAFKADGRRVEVMTMCQPNRDCITTRIKSELLKNGQAALRISLPYPTGQHADAASDWKQTALHTSDIIDQGNHYAVIRHSIDTTTYYLVLNWDAQASLQQAQPHEYVLKANGNDVLLLTAEYLPTPPTQYTTPINFEGNMKAVIKFWHRQWSQGAFADFSQCTDPRAQELERRVVLSQYLTYINCANNMPPQETGLTYNTWYGRPHLEMAWWHSVDFCLWNHPQVVEQQLKWYQDMAAPVARKIAERQGFKGLRWMKMTDPWAGEAPSNVGSFLTWQQPHFIYFAEEMYRHNTSAETLKKYAANVEETAAFMADFAASGTKNANDKKIKKNCQSSNVLNLIGQTSMQESMRKDFSYNHPFELAYFRYGLEVAQLWRERQGLERHKEWDEIIDRLAPLPQNDSIYMAGQPLSSTNMTDDFLLHSRSDHPAVLGACGLLPSPNTLNASRAPIYNKEKMAKTLRWVMKNWNWDTTWGWDYGMIAMAAARLGERQTAIDALLIDRQKNTYLVSGHNYQEPRRLRLYLPGNGSLLTAVAMMCAGWDGCSDVLNPGFPDNGQWNVRWEGFKRMQ